MPAHLGKQNGGVITIKIPKNGNNTTSKLPEVYNSSDVSNRTNPNISSISTSKEGSRNSTDNDLIVGSLNLVRLICQWICYIWGLKQLSSQIELMLKSYDIHWTYRK